MKSQYSLVILLVGLAAFLMLLSRGARNSITAGVQSPVLNSEFQLHHASYDHFILPNTLPVSTNKGGGGWDSVSDACHIDVHCCGDGAVCKGGEASWHKSIPSVRSAILLYFPNRTENQYCGGVLVNNTSLDFKPYVITAWHCAGDKWEIDAPTIEFYWNYEHPTCRPRGTQASGQPGNGTTTQFRKGAIVRDEWKGADLVLLELKQVPASSWDVYYAGWDASGVLPNSSTYVHFPEFSEKRITFNYDQLRSESILRDWGYVSTLVVDNWELGGYQGSSGSPLFDAKNRLVGIGSGSPDKFWKGSACEPPPPGGARWTGHFGRFRAAWTATGKKGTQLRQWLDSCNTMSDPNTWDIWDGIDMVSPFADVPVTHPQYFYIDALYRAGFVVGCGTDSNGKRIFCPNDELTRAESAVFIERGYHGNNINPPQPKTQRFSDLPLSSWAAKWAEALYQDRFTAGCQSANEPLKFCPWQKHTRAEAAVFFLRMLNGPDYRPPNPKGIFEDVPVSAWYAKWVEAAYQKRLMFPCGQGSKPRFCPDAPLTRAAAAEIMTRARGLPLPCVPGAGANQNAVDVDNYTKSNSISRMSAIIYSTYLGGRGDEEGNDIVVDKAGNIYMVGYTDSVDMLVSGLPAGDRDAFVAKLGTSGQLEYITYLGGTDLDEGMRIAVDDAGNVTILGHTDSADFPTRNAWQDTLRGERNLFVTRLDADGQIVYSTYLGGSNSEEGFGLAVDSAGNAYITGRTFSTDFPVTANAWQLNNAGGYDAFVTKLNPLGILIYSTYLGGSENDAAHDLTIDSAGNIYLVGDTGSSDFPTIGDPVQNNLAGANDAFVAKFSHNWVLLYSTYLGGTDGDFGKGIAVDDAGHAFVTGYTASRDFPLQNPAQSEHGGSSYDAFLVKLSPNGKALVYSTFFGGSGGDEGHSIAVNTDGVATITGATGSIDLSIAGSLPTTTNGSQDIFVVSFTPDGSQLLLSRYLGGQAGEQGNGLFVDARGDIYVTGYTLSPNFPLVNPLQNTVAGERDVFVVKLGQHRTYLPLVTGP